MASIFDQINREDIGNHQELNKRQPLYTPSVRNNSMCFDQYELRSQLDANGVASLGYENSQFSELPDPFITSRQDKMEENNRFNYGLDMSVNKRLIDISGQLIANEDLRVIPQRSTQIHAYQTVRVLPYNERTAKLSHDLANVIPDNRFNVKDVSASARYKINNPSFNYRDAYNIDKNEKLYGAQPRPPTIP
jgi:hypothetical protein